MCDLQEKDQRQVSLGIIKPSAVENFVAEETEREFPEEYLMKLRQQDIFRTDNRKPLEKIPYRFSYKYRCEDSECKGHRQMITDWEIGALYLRMRDQYQDEEIACDKVRERFQDTICATDKDTHFFVGTTLRHGTWIIIGTFWPKKANNCQQLTFSDIPAS